jgi:uncharacterized protein
MASGWVPAPAAGCWLHAEVEVRPSAIAQLGLFARTPIPAGTVACRLGGRLVSGAELTEILAAAAGRPDPPYIDTITVGDDSHLILPAGQPVRYGNHSCDPNLWWTGPYTLTARRLIEAGEEVTNDYATSTGVADFSMNCACGTALCRGMITGRDWEDHQLQDRYGDHWVPALLDRMRRS